MKSIHRKCFTGTCLTISKACDDTSLKQTWKERLQCCLVNIISCLFFVKSIVKRESMVLDVLCNTVHFVLRLVYFYLRISGRNSINLPVGFFLLENRSLSDIDSKFCLTVTLMGGEHFLSELILFDHKLKVDIDIFAWCHIVGFFFLFFLFGLLHFDPSLFAFLLNLLDGFHGWVSNLNKKKFICMYFRNLFSVCFQKRTL